MKKIRFKGNEYPIFPFSALRVLFDKEKTKYESSNIQDALVETDTRLTSVEDSTSSLKNDLSSHTHDDRYYTETEINTKLNNKLDKSLKGSKNGVAELDSNGMIPSSQLPSFVDDVLEGTAVNTSIDSHTNAVSATGFKLTGETKECTPESGKIYLDTSSGIQYRWSGTVYISTGSFLALGETSATAYRGDRGKTAYEHSQSTHARTDATKTAKSSTNGNVLINGTETVVYTHPSGTNPHGTTKSDVGLGNVGNFKAVSTVASQGLSTTEKTNARNNIGAGTSSFSGSYNDLSNKPSIPNVVNDLTSTSTTDALSAYQGKVLNDSKVDKKDGYTTNCKVNFTSGDIADSNVTTNTKWTTVSPLTGDMIHYDLFNKISTMFKNIRYLYKMLGTTDISAIGDGTVTGGLSTLNSNFNNYQPKGSYASSSHNHDSIYSRAWSMYTESAATKDYDSNHTYYDFTAPYAGRYLFIVNFRPIHSDSHCRLKIGSTGADPVGGVTNVPQYAFASFPASESFSANETKKLLFEMVTGCNPTIRLHIIKVS